ncbi:DNA oxidative demethylase AlkB [Candidatus Paracaedibacter symbiosus]|uniref:DNA oxidative demethylase AlkB n=1 Tax=Candidatus Paracaedibacter symbiosus TaxID=244582 RepID=UPI000509C36E|nr:DNA oxidative demethylase AlkB [Candidatus Paracaedibacter symbiosus]
MYSQLSLFEPDRADELCVAGAVVLRGLARSNEFAILSALQSITQAAPFRHMVTPGGYRMSVAMTNCGSFGWVTDHKGYRYDAKDPDSGQPWPPMPKIFSSLATAAADKAGFPGFKPDTCLINLYKPGAKLSLHQDKDELDFSAPIVSVSLGLQATFLFGGLRRSDFVHKVLLTHGDIVVWGGPARLAYHGIMPVKNGEHPLLGATRINLTFRKAKGETIV